MLADVAEELDGGQPGGPVVVVHHGRGVAALEGQEPFQLPAHRRAPLLHGVEAVHHALAGLLRVTDHPGGTADQPVGLVAGVLEALEREDLQQVPHVQAGSGRVEAAVELDHTRGELGAQRVKVGRVRDQAAPLELVEEVVEAGHLRSFRWVSAGVKPASSRVGPARRLPRAAARRCRAVRRHARLTLDPEPPGTVGRETQTDPRTGPYGRRGHR